MDVIVVLYVIALVLAVISLFVPTRSFYLLAAAVIVTLVALLLPSLGVD